MLRDAFPLSASMYNIIGSSSLNLVSFLGQTESGNCMAQVIFSAVSTSPRWFRGAFICFNRSDTIGD